MAVLEYRTLPQVQSVVLGGVESAAKLLDTAHTSLKFYTTQLEQLQNDSESAAQTLLQTTLSIPPSTP